MTCIMDPVFQRQPAAMWPGHNVVEMEYTNYSHPPPFTSPPATPMTPITPVTPHHTFAVPQYEHGLPGPAPPYHSALPPPHPSAILQPLDYRLYAMCQHLHSYPQGLEADHKMWWEEFMAEFFHENATLAIEVDLGEGVQKFCLTRQWICWYFKSMWENGVVSLHVNLGQCMHSFHQNMQQLECRCVTMETEHTLPQQAKVCTNGSLIVDFSLEDKPRIVSWYFQIKDHTEYIPRTCFASIDEGSLTTNITCKGILPATQKLLISASMMESGIQDSAVPGSNISVIFNPDIAGPANQWPEPVALHAGLNGSLPAISPTTTQPSSMLTTSAPPLLIQSQTTGSSTSNKLKQGKVSTKKGKNSPTLRKSQFVLVASEAIPLTAAEDMVQGVIGVDERTITRVNTKTPGSDSSDAPNPTWSAEELDHNALGTSR